MSLTVGTCCYELGCRWLKDVESNCWNEKRHPRSLKDVRWLLDARSDWLPQPRFSCPHPLQSPAPRVLGLGFRNFERWKMGPSLVMNYSFSNLIKNHCKRVISKEVQEYRHFGLILWFPQWSWELFHCHFFRKGCFNVSDLFLWPVKCCI